MMNVYSAGAWFSDAQAEQLVQTNKYLKQNKSVDNLFIPEESNNVNEFAFGTKDWSRKQYALDVMAINQADIIVATLKDGEIDTGTIWEMGYARAMNKPIYVVTDAKELNLMPAWGALYFVHDVKALSAINFNQPHFKEWNGAVE